MSIPKPPERRNPPTTGLAEQIACHPDRDRRVFAIESAEGRVWVKRNTKNHANIALRLLGVIRGTIRGAVARCTGRAGETVVGREVAVSRALRRKGALVPDVLYRDAECLALTDIGPTLHQVVREATEVDRPALLHKAAIALRELHDAGGWHGAAQLKNMTLCGDQVGFIDFENTVDRWLTLTARQCFDVWQLGFAVARFDRSGRLAVEAIAAYGEGRVLRRLRVVSYALWPTCLLMAPVARWLPRDAWQSLVCFNAIRVAGARSVVDR